MRSSTKNRLIGAVLMLALIVAIGGAYRKGVLDGADQMYYMLKPRLKKQLYRT